MVSGQLFKPLKYYYALLRSSWFKETSRTLRQQPNIKDDQVAREKGVAIW